MVSEKVIFNGVEYDARHGGPFDRGSADSWYSRERRPHMFTDATHQSMEIEERFMTQSQIRDYDAGYEYNEQFGGKKSYD
jgi:hypothetical protein